MRRLDVSAPIARADPRLRKRRGARRWGSRTAWRHPCSASRDAARRRGSTPRQHLGTKVRAGTGAGCCGGQWPQHEGEQGQRHLTPGAQMEHPAPGVSTRQSPMACPLASRPCVPFARGSVVQGRSRCVIPRRRKKEPQPVRSRLQSAGPKVRFWETGGASCDVPAHRSLRPWTLSVRVGGRRRSRRPIPRAVTPFLSPWKKVFPGLRPCLSAHPQGSRHVLQHLDLVIRVVESNGILGSTPLRLAQAGTCIGTPARFMVHLPRQSQSPARQHSSRTKSFLLTPGGPPPPDRWCYFWRVAPRHGALQEKALWLCREISAPGKNSRAYLCRSSSSLDSG